MNKPIEGGCQCGAVRYAVGVKALIGYACHCKECKKQTASAFAISVPVPSRYVTLSGATTVYRRSTDSGTFTNCHFCPACGTRVFHQSDRSPDLMTLKGGTLDDSSALPLVAHLWTKRKEVWVILQDDAEVFETQPADLKTWRNALITKLEPL